MSNDVFQHNIAVETTWEGYYYGHDLWTSFAGDPKLSRRDIDIGNKTLEEAGLFRQEKDLEQIEGGFVEGSISYELVKRIDSEKFIRFIKSLSPATADREIMAILNRKKIEAEALIKAKLDPEYHHLIQPEHIQRVVNLNGVFEVVEHEGEEKLHSSIVTAISDGEVWDIGGATPQAPLYVLWGADGEAYPFDQNAKIGDPVSYREVIKEAYIEIVPKKDSSDRARQEPEDPGEASSLSDRAMLGPRTSQVTGHTSPEEAVPGGIDLNKIDVKKEGPGSVEINFDPVEIQNILNGGVDGFAPVIINIVPVTNIMPLLGLEPKTREEYAVSKL